MNADYMGETLLRSEMKKMGKDGNYTALTCTYIHETGHYFFIYARSQRIEGKRYIEHRFAVYRFDNDEPKITHGGILASTWED